VANCSTFIKGMYGQRGIQIGRSLNEQLNEGMPIQLADDYSNVREGDLLFRRRTKSEVEIGYYEEDPDSSVAHVGLATGQGTVLHMTAFQGTGLSQTPLEEFVKPNNAFMRRFVRDWKNVDVFCLSDGIDFERSTDIRTEFLLDITEQIRQNTTQHGSKS
jgi:cell wall-associated NlpC family hydrolase